MLVIRTLYEHRNEIPWCKIINDERYNGGSMYWVKISMYEESLAENQRQQNAT